MADKAAQLEACKAAASNYHLQLQSAATKSDALASAIGAAENFIKALKLASDPEERKKLRSQCTEMMNIADQIKNSPKWTPQVHQPPSINSNKQNENCATEVAVPAELVIPFENLNLQSSSLLHDSSSTAMPVGNVHPASSHLPVSLSLTSNHSAVEPKWPESSTSSVPSLPVDGLGNHDSLKTGSIFDASQRNKLSDKTQRADLSTVSSPDRNLNRPIERTPRQLQTSNIPKVTSSLPKAVSDRQIRKLSEPVSSRKRSRREEIILLKASVISGFKCPPWTEAPKPTEFALQDRDNVYTDTHTLSLSSYQQQFFKDWVRAKHAMAPSNTIGANKTGNEPSMSSSESIDLVQDAATDCSVVTSLCAGIARSERGHDQILANKLYPFDERLNHPVLSLNGKYIVRLNFNGCWRKVIIDDRLPVSSTHRVLHVIDRRNPALLWPALLEKAYLKVRGGYDFPGSNSCSDLWTLTGWIPEQAFLQETDTVPHQLWNRIYNAFLYGDVLVTAGTGRMSSRQERELGLEGQHSYVVLDMIQKDQDRLFLVKNPWAEGKGWRGTRPSIVDAMSSIISEDDSKKSLMAYHKYCIPTDERPYPTTFWIGLEQLTQHFESLYLNWNPGLFRCRQDIHFEWNIESPSRGGCIVNHPQFSLAPTGAGPVWLLLSRHFQDIPSDTKDKSETFNEADPVPETQASPSGESSKGYMSICVFNSRGERLFMKDTYLESSDYVATPQCLLRWNTNGDLIYTVLIDQEDLQPSLYMFTLTAFSNSPLSLEPATRRYAQQRIEKGAWTRQSAGGNTSSARYFENPQYSLEVGQRGPLAILLMSDSHEHPLHVKLALGHKKRLHRLQSRDVLADSGDHRSGCAFAEIKDLEPGLYTVICSLFEAGKTGGYTLRIDSTSVVGFRAIPREGAGLLSTKLSPACFGANIHKVAAPLLPRRLASYTIIARFLKATNPRSADLGKMARSPLRFSVEIGRGPERKSIISSEGGEYMDAATVRSESVNIDPMLARQGDIYLVLDRLSGPGGPVEEWYEVEIYTDTPQACEIGVWQEWDD